MKRIISAIICLFMVVTFVPSFAYASAGDGVQNRITSLKQLYPSFSYFSANGLACTHASSSSCSNCSLKNVISAKHPEYKSAGLNDAWTCCAFARFAFYYIFGLNSYYIKSNSTLVSLQDAKIGDYVKMNSSAHYGIFLYQTSTKVYLYDANGAITAPKTNRVSYGETGYSKASNTFLVYHANNYDTINNALSVSLNSNGGNCTLSSITVNAGSTYGVLPIASRTGYSFAGWYSALSGGSQITASTTVSITSNHTLYAHWIPLNYTVSFNPNGGTVSIGSKTVTYGSTYGTLPTPIKSGYTFNGWYKAQSGTIQVTESTKVTLATSHTLFAEWILNSSVATVGNIERLSANRASSTSIRLTWRKALNATGYHIFRSTSAEGTYVYITTIYTSPNSYMIFTNTGLVKGKTYYYQVRAFNKVGTTVTKGAMSSYVYAKAY